MDTRVAALPQGGGHAAKRASQTLMCLQKAVLLATLLWNKPSASIGCYPPVLHCQGTVPTAGVLSGPLVHI